MPLLKEDPSTIKLPQRQQAHISFQDQNAFQNQLIAISPPKQLEETVDEKDKKSLLSQFEMEFIQESTTPIIGG